MKEKLFQKLRGANKEGLFQVANEGAEKFKIKWDHIKLLRDSTGMETYAFGVEDINHDPKTFYNLIFKLTPEGTPYQPYLMKYSMTEAFAEQYYATGSLDGFTGSIQKIVIKDLYTAFPGLMVNPDNEEQMVGEPCPNSTKMDSGSTSSGGTGTSGSGITDTGNYEDQGPGFSMNTRCAGFVQATDWYHCFDAACSNKIFTHTTYEYSTVCSTSYSLNSAAGAEDDACEQKTEDTPIIQPDLLDCSVFESLGYTCDEMDEFQTDYRSRMSESELRLFKSLSPTQRAWYLANAKQATDYVNHNYPNSTYNGKGDAFRHALFHALNSLTIGTSLSEQLGTRHEDRTPNYLYGHLEKEMDLWNNQIGREWSNYQERGFNSITESLNWAFSNGYMRYLTNLEHGGTGRATAQSVLVPTKD